MPSDGADYAALDTIKRGGKKRNKKRCKMERASRRANRHK